FPHRYAARRPDSSRLPPPDGIDRRHGHGTQPHALEHMVSGSLSGRQPDAGMSAVQFQQLGSTRYETAFGISHKLRAGMVRPEQDRIGGKTDGHVEVDENLCRWKDTRRRPGCSS
ncbi:hypothetical protein OY671_009591, partial [Metschnikowia pulcherrima]